MLIQSLLNIKLGNHIYTQGKPIHGWPENGNASNQMKWIIKFDWHNKSNLNYPLVHLILNWEKSDQIVWNCMLFLPKKRILIHIQKTFGRKRKIKWRLRDQKFCIQDKYNTYGAIFRLCNHKEIGATASPKRKKAL